MALTREQMEALIRSLELTRSEEMSCDECLRELAEFVENELDGKSVPESLEAVAHHLRQCAECREEYQALLRALEEEE